MRLEQILMPQTKLILQAEKHLPGGIYLGPPVGMESTVEPLPVVKHLNGYASVWRLDSVQLDVIIVSKRIIVNVLGNAHPPIMLSVFS